MGCARCCLVVISRKAQVGQVAFSQREMCLGGIAAVSPEDLQPLPVEPAKRLGARAGGIILWSQDFKLSQNLLCQQLLLLPLLCAQAGKFVVGESILSYLEGNALNLD